MPASSHVKKLVHKVSTLMFGLLEILGLPWTPRAGKNRERQSR